MWVGSCGVFVYRLAQVVVHIALRVSCIFLLDRFEIIYSISDSESIYTPQLHKPPRNQAPPPTPPHAHAARISRTCAKTWVTPVSTIPEPLGFTRHAWPATVDALAQVELNAQADGDLAAYLAVIARWLELPFQGTRSGCLT
jgi:hypothetical protein